MQHAARRALCACALAGTLVAGACDDLPTAPQVWAREAVGRQWVAVSEPAGLAGAGTWLPWAAPEVRDSVRALLAHASREHRAGRLEVAMAEREAAARLASGGVASDPDAVTVLGALAALESWVDRAGGAAESGRFPALAEDVERARALGAEARAALAAGGTAAACARITEASIVARRWTPMAVAARAVAEAEATIALDPDPGPALLRARRLLRSARVGAASGDEVRALQRALYALQLMEHARGS